MFPKDARYKISEVKYTILRLNETISSVRGSGENADFISMERVVKRGDFLKVEIVKLSRVNFMNKEEEVEMDGRVFLIPII